MPQIIRLKRNVTTANAPGTLDPGELAYTKMGGHNLYIGDDTVTVNTLVSANRQVELTGNQGPINGTKTFGPTGIVSIDDVANLLLPGGNAGEFLATDGAGNLSFAPALTASQQFVGSVNGTTGVVIFTTASGGAGPGLPAAALANNGWYVIFDTEGATPPAGAGAGVTGPFDVGDWIISNGTVWTHLAFGGISSVVASDVGVAPAVAGGSDVQTALEGLEAAQQSFVVGPAVAIDSNFAAFDTTTGLLIKDSLQSASSILTQAKTYVDTANTAQDTAQDARDDAQDVLIAANTASIATKGDVYGPAASVVDQIAVYSNATGKLIKDGGTTIAAINAAIALKADTAYVDSENALDVKIAGSTMTGVLLLSEHPVAGDPALQATTKQYVDDGLASVAAGASVLVTGPELVGNGLLGTEITFTGITLHTNVAAEMSGNGLSTSPLNLTVVDGGVYT